MGDSDQDVPMLEAADSWYAPASCSPRVRALAHSRGGRIVARPRQRGLLEAAQDLLRKEGVLADDIPNLCRPVHVRTAMDLLVALLHAVDRPRLSHFLATFSWRRV